MKRAWGRFVVVWAAGVAGALAAPADAAGGESAPWVRELPGDANPFVQLLPALRTAPTPAWVRRGTRITYYSSSAIVIGAREYYVRDEDGNWKDQHGNHYRKERGGDGTGGHGYTQVNVAALDRQRAVLDIRMYSFVDASTSRPPMQFGAGSALALPGAGADYWLSPRVLRQVGEGRFDGTRIVRMPYTVGGKTYRALRFQYERKGARIVHVFDLETGLLLHSNSATDVQGLTPTTPGRAEMGSTRQMLTQSTYVGHRDVPIPWSRRAGARWPAGLRRLRYDGSTTVSVPGCMPVSLPVRASSTVSRRGADWAQYTFTVSVNGGYGLPPNTRRSERVSGLGQFGAIWVPPAALAALRAGQVLDRDPLTQVVTSVSHAGPALGLGRVVAVSESNAVQRLDYTYDAASGLLVAYGQVDGPLHMRTQMTLADQR
ncbi:MAG: hypothetical protein ACLF0G_00845 [Candidatus Brocadiia bacterium]